MNKSYIPALDGIRFLAVSFVLIDHWSGDSLGFPLSYLGVCMFFVLSGFLITRILLNSKKKDEDLGRTHGFSLRQFYIRRTIRIFPIYYLTLAFLFVANITPVRDKIWWLVSYNTNNYIAINETWLGSVDHLWSLAVEEQFYLFFPFLIFFLPWRNINKMLIFSVLLSVALRAFFYLRGDEWMRSYVLVFTCLDAFGLGGMLAYALRNSNQKVINFLSGWSPFLISILFYVALVTASGSMSDGHNFLTSIWLRLFESILSVTFIAKLVLTDSLPDNFSKLFTKLFEGNVVIFLGRISYGMYIYHNFVYNFYHSPANSPIVKLVNFIEQNTSTSFQFHSVKFVVLYGITVAIATLSWFIIEQPINKFKDRFGY